MTDWKALREETRGVNHVTHLNNSGAALPPAPVVDAVIEHLRLEERIGPYEAAAAHTAQGAAVYDNAAQLVGCQPTEIAFCDSASRAWNSLVYSLPLKDGDLILTSRIEFGSGLIALQHAAERSGARVIEVPSDDHGVMDLDALDSLLDRDPVLVAVTHAAAHSGAVNPVEAIGQRVERSSALYIVDACQSVGQMSIDVATVRCDALTATGRKWLRGPRGTGFLYVSSQLAATIDPVTSDLVTTDYLFTPSRGSLLEIRSDSRKFELWERSIAGTIGLATAIEYAMRIGLPAIANRVTNLSQILADGLRSSGKLDLWGPSRVESGIVSFGATKSSASRIKDACAAASINVSTMAVWDAPLDFNARHAEVCIRLAPHYYNTEEEVQRAVSVVTNVA